MNIRRRKPTDSLLRADRGGDTETVFASVAVAGLCAVFPDNVDNERRCVDFKGVRRSSFTRHPRALASAGREISKFKSTRGESSVAVALHSGSDFQGLHSIESTEVIAKVGRFNVVKEFWVLSTKFSFFFLVILV